MKRILALFLTLALLLPALAMGADAIESYTLKVGATKLLKIDTGGKAVQSALWNTNSPSVTITESASTYCYIKAMSPTGGLTAIVDCTYYYWIYVGNYSYLAKGYESFKITVEAVEPTSISLPSSRQIGLEKGTTLSPTLSPSGATADLTWSTSNSSVATVNQNGYVYGVSGGTARITVRTNNGLSASCSVTVAEPNLTLSSTSPARGALEWDADKPITLTYSARLAAGSAWDGIVLHDLTAGTEVESEPSISGRVLTITPSVLLPGHAYSLTVPAGALKNLTGAPLSGSNTLPFSVKAMSLTATQPEPDAVSVSTDQPVSMTFDTPLSPGGKWSELSFVDAEGASVPADFRLQGETLVVTPRTALDYVTSYTLTVPAGALAEPGGGENTVPYSLSFTTWAGAPLLEASQPEDGEALADPAEAITLTFRWPVQAGPEVDGIRLVKKDTGEAVAGRLTWSGKTVTFTPSADLELSTAYRFTIPAAGVQNDQGQSNGTPYTFAFTTWSTQHQPLSAPTFSNQTSIYSPGSTVTLQCAREEASIYYTLDGTDPVRSGALYTDPIPLTGGEICLRAVAVLDGAVSPERQMRYSPKCALTPGQLDSLGSSGSDGYNAAAAGDGVWAAAGNVSLDAEEAGDWAGISSRGGQDAAIVQYTPEGEVAWKAAFGGSGTDAFLGLAALPQGDWIAAGYSQMDGYPGGDWGSLAGQGDSDATLARFDRTGTLTWCANLGGTGSEQFRGVAAGHSGFAAAGDSTQESAGTGDLAELDYRGGTRDGLVAAYDPDGRLLWSRLYGGSDADYLYGIAAAADGYVAVGSAGAGSFGTGDLAGLSGWGGSDAIIVKFDHQGQVVWQTRFGGKGDDRFRAVIQVSDGYVAVGESASTSMGNGDWSDLGKMGGNEGIIVKFSPSGQVVWKLRLGGNGEDIFRAVADTGYGLAVAGSAGSTSFRTGTWYNVYGRGLTDATLFLLTYQGALCDLERTGGTSNDAFNGLAVLPQGIMAVGDAGESSFGTGDWTSVSGMGGFDATCCRYTAQLGLRFDAAGGSGAPARQSGQHGDTLTLPAEIPVKEGSTFLGWSPWRNVQAAVYQPGDTVLLDRDMTLYAVWDANCPVGALGLTGADQPQAGEEFTRTLFFRTEEPVSGGRVVLRLPEGIACLELEHLLADVTLVQTRAAQGTVTVEFSFPQTLKAGETAAIGTLHLLADPGLEPGEYAIQADLERSSLTSSDGAEISLTDALVPPVVVGRARIEELFLLGPDSIAGPTQFQLAAFPVLPEDVQPVWQVTGGQATVDENGIVTPLADGTVTLTATVDGIQASATVTVQRLVHTLTGTATWQDGVWQVSAGFDPAWDKTLLAAWHGPDGVLGPVVLQKALAGQTAAELTLAAPADGAVTLYLLEETTLAPLAPACLTLPQE